MEPVSGGNGIQMQICLIPEHVFLTNGPLLIPHIDLLMNPVLILLPLFFGLNGSVPEYLLFHLFRSHPLRSRSIIASNLLPLWPCPFWVGRSSFEILQGKDEMLSHQSIFCLCGSGHSKLLSHKVRNRHYVCK